MNLEDIAYKIHRALNNQYPAVLVMLKPTPTKNNLTVRCVPADRLEQIRATPGKWLDWIIFGVYDKNAPLVWIEEDIEFVLDKEGINYDDKF